MKNESVRCGVCPNIFVKKMVSQLYCSRDCYKKAWPINNREKAAEKSRLRRQSTPEWYRRHEPGYYRTYRGKQIIAKPWRYTFQSRRLDANKNNIPFTITHEWAAARWTGRCELTNVEFKKNPEGRGPYPFSCTIDRIKPELGYTPENCRFILWGCNGLKGSGTDKDMYEIAKALIANISHTDSLGD